MNLFHSISIALPKWVRADLPDFKKESNVGYGLIQVLLKDYPPPPSPLVAVATSHQIGFRA